MRCRYRKPKAELVSFDRLIGGRRLLRIELQRMLIAETDRTVLRHFHVADLDAMAAVFGDAEVIRFGPGPQPREWVEKWLKGCLEDYYQKWGFGLWAVVHKSNWAVIGFCGLTLFDCHSALQNQAMDRRFKTSHGSALQNQPAWES